MGGKVCLSLQFLDFWSAATWLLCSEPVVEHSAEAVYPVQSAHGCGRQAVCVCVHVSMHVCMHVCLNDSQHKWQDNVFYVVGKGDKAAYRPETPSVSAFTLHRAGYVGGVGMGGAGTWTAGV